MGAYMELARWYDALTGDVPYGQFADYYESRFRERGKQVRTVLDFACGTGTLTCLLAQRGYELVAVDASPDMLMELSEKAAGLEHVIPPLILCQDAADLDLNDVVDAAVCSLDGINYLPEQTLCRLLERLHLFIHPNGLFIFDINAPERLESLDGQTFVDETEDVLCLWRAEFDGQDQTLFYGMDLFTRLENGLWERSEEEHIEYAYQPEVLKQMLSAAGFVNITVDRSGPQNRQGRIFITAENTPH